MTGFGRSAAVEQTPCGGVFPGSIKDRVDVTSYLVYIVQPLDPVWAGLSLNPPVSLLPSGDSCETGNHGSGAGLVTRLEA